MKTFSYTIQDSVGIHARPAGMLVKKVSEFQSAVTIHKEEKKADGRRLFAIMSLAAKQGDKLTIDVEGPDENEAAEALEAFLKANL